MPCTTTRRGWPSSPLLVSGLLWFFVEASSFAADKVWTGGQNNDWGSNNNWSGSGPSGTDNAKFNGTFSNQPNLTGNATVGGIWVTGAIGQNVTISASSGTLTLQGNTINGTANLGILIDNSNPFTLTISAPVKLGNAQTWTNNSGNLFTVSGGINLNNKALTINGTGNTIIAGAISGAGSFIQTGTGTLSITSTANSFSGQLTFQSGTLKIDTINNAGSNGELGNSSLSVILGGAGNQTGVLEYTGVTASSTKRFTMATGGTGSFQIDSAGTNLTLSGIIDGSGGLLKAGLGTLTLTGVNTYSGGSIINAGTVVVNSASSLGAGTGGLTINAATLEVSSSFSSTRNISISDSASTILVDASQTYTTTGTISGTGTLNKSGLGTLVLGTNSYSGGTSLVAGTIQIGSSGTLGSTSGSLAISSGTLDLGGTSQTVGALSGTGGTILNNASSTSSALTIGYGGGSGTYGGVIADHNAGTGTVAVTKVGTGTETLTGANTYTGSTTINAGSFFVNGSTAAGSAVSVFNSGTTLGGSGTINGSINLVSAGTNLSPGASGVGSISILQTGPVTLGIGSNFNIDINGAVAGTSYDQLKVSGTLSIAGSNLNITAGSSLSIGQTFYVVLNDGSDAITGTFSQGSSVMTSNGDVFLINYAANGDGGLLGNDISLTVSAVPEPSNWLPAVLAIALLIRHERRKLGRLVSMASKSISQLTQRTSRNE